MHDVDSWLDVLGEAIESFDCEDPNEKCHQYKTPIRVPRIDYDSITPEEFYNRYSKTNTPIILGNADAHMPMHLTAEYWRTHHGDRIVPLDVNMPSQVA
jgi:hypothetical protein